MFAWLLWWFIFLCAWQRDCKFKAKENIAELSLNFRGSSINFKENDTQKSFFDEYVYDLGVDDAVCSANTIKDIPKYHVKKHCSLSLYIYTINCPTTKIFKYVDYHFTIPSERNTVTFERHKQLL